MRVLIADKLSSFVPERLEAAGCAVTTDASLQDDALLQALRDLDPQVLVVRGTKVRGDHLLAAPGLSLVIRAGAGVNTIDVKTAASRGIYVANCPGKNAVAVAELTIGHLVNLDRRLSDNVTALREGRWAKKEFSKARGLKGRTLAILGVGDIGREVIRRAKAFDMHVRAWSRSLTPEKAEALGVEYAATPRAACRGADALSIHLALTAETRGLVSRDLLEALNPGAFVINTSRGEVLDHAALEEAIRTRGLRAGLDVFDNEPTDADKAFPHAIGQNPSVYGTHHIGASTDQSSDEVGEAVVNIVETYLRTGDVPDVVNIARKSPATHLLVVRHADRVGVLATVLGLLREAGINVQEMQNIIFQGAEAATARIQVDRAPPPDVLRAIEESGDVFAASLVSLEA